MENVRRKVIIVTDGDKLAGKTVQVAARNVGARFIATSTGNPTPITGHKAVELIKQAPNDPVVILVDDRGKSGMGKGEKIIKSLVEHPDIEVIGVVAVASNSNYSEGVEVDESITSDCTIIDGPVDKTGNPEKEGHKKLKGDTVDILNRLKIPIIIGTGDTGKMEFADGIDRGAPVTTKALQEIIKRSI
jgi:stage V sporulation protein AE